MATIDLGKIKLVWRGTYAGGTAYTVDDVVQHTDSGLTSSFICTTNSTGNAPSTGGSVHGSWAYLAKGGVAGTDVGTTLTTQGDILYRDGSGLQRLAKPASDMYLKNTSAGAVSWSALSSQVDLVSHTSLDSTGVNTISTTTNWATNNYYKMEVFMQYQMSANQGMWIRFRNASGDISSQDYGFIGWYTHSQTNHSNSNLAIWKDVNGSLAQLTANGWGFNSGFINPNLKMEIYKPDANGRQSALYQWLNHDESSPPYYAHYEAYGWTSETSTKTGWSLIGNNSSNIKNGFYTVLGYKYV